MTDSKRRIVILGANGNVGTEISLILRHFIQYDLVPVCCSGQGSSYLRYMGVPCAHGAITDTVRVFALLARSTVIANFALAYTPTGSPRKLSELNRQIVASVFANAPRDATRSDVLDMGGLGDSRPPVNHGISRPGIPIPLERLSWFSAIEFDKWAELA
ncbi:hypothetical protein SAMN05519103_09330 [Rhizobiales bacterium GAS113]|nr:hypothetical protein SAMN05519103_09330 [Rhizobiales bacterium GAS113]